jgi:hypothetical protein
MINKTTTITKFEDSQVPALMSLFDSLYNNASGIRYVDKEPTAKNVGHNDLVIYDDGSGTKRLYLLTGKGNLSYLTLT